MEQAYIYETKIGKILIAQDQQGITEVSIVTAQDTESDSKVSRRNCEYQFQETELIKETRRQLLEYLEGDRTEFTVSLNPKGTNFQKKVWEALRAIPYGETRSYKQIACSIGNEKAVRAIGGANHVNPIMCIIPCHRVIGADGSLVGYAGGLQVKEQLLNMEKRRA